MLLSNIREIVYSSYSQLIFIGHLLLIVKSETYLTYIKHSLFSLIYILFREIRMPSNQNFNTRLMFQKVNMLSQGQ